MLSDGSHPPYIITYLQYLLIMIKAIRKLPKTKVRKKRARHYKTGIHCSNKCETLIKYRSGWELEVCKFLDRCSNVLKYEYESIAIPYISNLKTGRLRMYYPDFIVHYSDGKKVIIEVKREDKLSNPKVMKKTQAGKDWAKKNGMEYQLWTNNLILRIKISNQMAKNK